MWVNYNGIANIIDINKFVVVKPDNSKMKFTMSRKGLYYTDTSPLIEKHLKVGVFSQVVSVKENFTNYTKRSTKTGGQGKKLQVTFKNISTKSLLKMIDNNMVKDLTITRQGVKLCMVLIYMY